VSLTPGMADFSRFKRESRLKNPAFSLVLQDIKDAFFPLEIRCSVQLSYEPVNENTLS